MFRRFMGLTAPFLCACLVFLTFSPLTSAFPIFEPAQGISSEAAGIQSGDLNGDQLEDLFVGGSQNILIGNGNGTFTVVHNRAYITSPLFPQQIFIGDLNHDGRADFADLVEDQFEIGLGYGNGSFNHLDNKYLLSSGGALQAQAMAIADFDQDGNLDIVFNEGAGILNFLKGKGDGTFSTRQQFAEFVWFDEMTVADFNMDGNLDIVGTNNEYPNWNAVSFFLGNGDGTFRSRSDYVVDATLTALIVLPAVVQDDFNHDGKPDIAVTLPPFSNGVFGFGAVYVLIGNGDGTFQPPQILPADRGPVSVVTGDFNGDHIVDLAAANQGSATISLYLGDGDGTFKAPQFYPSGKTGVPFDLVASDFNQDGRTDLAVLISGGVNLLLSKPAPPLVIQPNPSVGVSGKIVTVMMTAAGTLTELPTATLTGSCVDEQKLDFTPTDQADTYSTTVTLPNSTTDCALTVKAQGMYVENHAPTEGSAVLHLDVTSPVTSLAVSPDPNQDRIFAQPPIVTINADDPIAGVDKTYYALDQPACQPDALANCSVYSQPFGVSGDGSHTLTYFSQDKVGNMEAAQSYSFKINSTVPQVTDRNIALDEDTSTEILLTATDAGSDPLTISVVQPPTHGELKRLEGDRYLYTPNSQYFGPDAFTYRASDGVNTSQAATVSISVRSVNDAPVAASFPVSTLGGQPIPIHLQATDVENDVLSFSLVTPPANGTLTGTFPDLLYLSKPGFSGQDSFTYIARDASSESEPATVTVTVIPPLVVIGSGTADPGETVTLPISVTDQVPNVAGLDLTFQGSGPSGTSLPAPAFTATPPNAWQVQTDPKNPWHVTLFRINGIAGPAEVAKVSFKIGASDLLDAVYRIEPQSVILFDETGEDTTATDRTVPGEVSVVACSDRVKGDLTGDGKVSVADVTALLRSAVGIRPLSVCDQGVADVNCDGKVNLGDAILTLRSALFGDGLACQE
jgi:hypothetical protein